MSAFSSPSLSLPSKLLQVSGILQECFPQFTIICKLGGAQLKTDLDNKKMYRLMVSVVKRHPLVTFFVLANGLSWGNYILSGTWPSVPFSSLMGQ
jgi:hypothetical protein